MQESFGNSTTFFSLFLSPPFYTGERRLRTKAPLSFYQASLTFEFFQRSEPRGKWKSKTNELVWAPSRFPRARDNRPRPRSLLRENSPLRNDARQLPRLGCLSEWLSPRSYVCLKASSWVRVMIRRSLVSTCARLQITSFADR